MFWMSCLDHHVFAPTLFILISVDNPSMPLYGAFLFFKLISLYHHHHGILFILYLFSWRTCELVMCRHNHSLCSHSCLCVHILVSWNIVIIIIFLWCYMAYLDLRIYLVSLETRILVILMRVSLFVLTAYIMFMSSFTCF